MEQTALVASFLIFISFLLIPVSSRLGAPILLLILAAGMLVGEDGPGNLAFDNFTGAHTVGSVALAVILFAGGLETRTKGIGRVWIPAIILASVGVLVTAAVMGVVAHYFLGMSVEHALLLGAVVGSTDAAATFLLIQQSRIGLSAKLQNTLTLESGLNDPMAIFATIAMTSIVNSGLAMSSETVLEFLPLLGLQLGIGAVVGICGGFALSSVIGRVRLSDGLYPPMVMAAAMVLYFATTLIEGSGFLAVYLCGLVLSWSEKQPVTRIRQFSEGLQWLSQIALFLMLGVLVTPSTLGATLMPALAAALLLIFVARPVAVFASISFLGFSVRELTFLSWVGLRGAVPIFLAILPVITPGPVGVEFFNTVFVVVVASLVLQGWTITPVARWTKVVEGQDRTSSMP